MLSFPALFWVRKNMCLWRLEIPQWLTPSLVSLYRKCGVVACIFCVWWWTAWPGVVEKLGSKTCYVYMSIRTDKIISNAGILDINDARFEFLYQGTSMQDCHRHLGSGAAYLLNQLGTSCLLMDTEAFCRCNTFKKNRMLFCWKKNIYWSLILKRSCKNMVKPWCRECSKWKNAVSCSFSTKWHAILPYCGPFSVLPGCTTVQWVMRTSISRTHRTSECMVNTTADGP